MKKDIFSDLNFDVIEAVPFDIVDQVELDSEDKILYSNEFRELLKEEVSKKISEIPFGEIVSKIAKSQVSKQLKDNDYESLITKNKDSFKFEVSKTKEELRSELEKVRKELKEKYAEFRNILNSQERYTFGGFAPPNPSTGAPGTVLQNSNGTWAGLVWATGSGANPTYIGDQNTNGSWRLFDDGINLLVQRREAGVWNDKGSFLS